MIITKRKNYIWIFLAIGVLLIGAAAALLFLKPKATPNAKALLEQADCLSKQNLCLMALLEEQPENKEYQQRLLDNFRVLDADPLTIQGMEQAFGLQATTPTAPQPEQPGSTLNCGGIAGMKKYKEAYSVAEGADTTYYATESGIYADYRGLQVRIAAVQASNLIAAEGGLYFLNDTQRAVQYLARDGHKIETLSPLSAEGFAFFNGQLWIVDTEQRLYCNENPIEIGHKVRALAATENALYAACNDEEGALCGLLSIDASQKQTLLFAAPAKSIFGGKDGRLYYINASDLPMRYDPTTKEAVILSEKTALSVTYENKAVYILNKKGKVKKIA